MMMGLGFWVEVAEYCGVGFDDRERHTGDDENGMKSVEW